MLLLAQTRRGLLLRGGAAALPRRVLFSTGAEKTSQWIVHGTQDNFDDLVQNPNPVIIDVMAQWCPPCKELGPILEKEVKAANGKVTLVKVDSDEQPFLARTLRVKSLPTVFGAHKGQVVDMFIGYPGPEKVSEFVRKLVALADEKADASKE